MTVNPCSLVRPPEDAAQKPAALDKGRLPPTQEPLGITLSAEAAGHVRNPTSGFGVKELFKKLSGEVGMWDSHTLPLNRTFRELFTVPETQPQAAA